MFERQRNGVGGQKCIAEPQHRKHAERRARGQVELGGDDVDAGSFRANQRARDVEIVLRQKLVEVVAGDAPRNARELFANQTRITMSRMRARPA